MPTKPLKISIAVSRLYRSTMYRDKPVCVNHAHFLGAVDIPKFQLLTRPISAASGAQTTVKVEQVSGTKTLEHISAPMNADRR